MGTETCQIMFAHRTALLCCLIAALSSCAHAGSRPHIVFMLADDWGSYDASWRIKELGRTPDISTPNIDNISAAGLRFENYYVQPICTPTRASLLTGRYSIHTGSEHRLFGASEPSCLPVDVPIMPEAFKAIGYQTHMLGKWHLGYVNNSCSPWGRGFDSYLGYLNGVGGYVGHTMAGIFDIHECTSLNASSCDTCTKQYEGEYSTHVYTRKAQELFEKWDTGDKPIFLYLAWQAVHEPLDVPAQYLTQFDSIKDPSRRIYAGMLAALDEGIGNITETLRMTGMTNNTILVLSNDNGGMSGSYSLGCCNCGTSCGGLNYPYRGWKDSFWEGGFRGQGFVSSPMLLNTPRRYSPLLHVSDWYRTLLGAALSTDTADERADAEKQLAPILSVGPTDSVDQWGSLSGTAESALRTEIVLAGIDVDKSGAALRVGDLKLLLGGWGVDTWCDLNTTGLSPIAPAPIDPNTKYHGPGGQGGLVCTRLGNGTVREVIEGQPWWELVQGLYNVTADPRELNDLQKLLPDDVARLKARLVELNATTAGTIHLPQDPAGAAHSKATDCWSPWRDL